MARYIDADVLIADLTKLADGYLYAESDKDKYTFVYGALTGVRQAIRYTEAEPTADVAEVVRCKDCKHRNPCGYKCLRDNLWHDSGDFCSYGERKPQEGE